MHLRNGLFYPGVWKKENIKRNISSLLKPRAWGDTALNCMYFRRASNFTDSGIERAPGYSFLTKSITRVDICVSTLQNQPSLLTGVIR